MKKNTQELNIDFIESRILTKEEEQKLSEYIKKIKEKANKPTRAKKAAQYLCQLNLQVLKLLDPLGVFKQSYSLSVVEVNEKTIEESKIQKRQFKYFNPPLR